MNALLAGAGAAFAALLAADVLAALAGPRSMRLVTAVIGTATSAGTRGRVASRDDRLRIGLLFVIGGSLVALAAGGFWLALVFALAGPLVPAGVVRARRARWRSAMQSGAAPAARAIADAAAAGLPGVGALERAAGDGAVPAAVGSELKDLAVRCRLGLPLDEGLEELGRRADSAGWSAIVAAIRVQREVGGDLAPILHALAGGLEDAERARAQARSLSSQARLTARIVIALPVAGLVLAEVASPGTVTRMLSSPLPRLLALLALVLQVVAAVVVRRVARLGERAG